MRPKEGKSRITVGVMVFGLLLTVMAVYGIPAVEGVEGAKKPIKIGIVYDISGPYAAISKVSYDMITQYLKYLNKQGGIAGHPVEVIFFDTASDPAKASTSIKRLIGQDKVYMILGNTITGNVIPMGLAAAEGETVYGAQSGSIVAEKQWRKAGPQIFHWTFRVNISGEPDMNLPICALLSEMKIKKIAIIHPESSYGKAQSSYFLKVAPGYGLEVVVKESFPVDSTVFGVQIASLKKYPEIRAVVSCGADIASALALAAVREAGMNVVTMSSVANATPEMMAVQRVSRAFSIQPGHIVQSWGGDGWESMPRGPQKDLFAELNDKFFQPTFGFKLSGHWYATALGTWRIYQNTWERIFKDKPDILDQDLATIRSTYRDYLENIKNFQTCLGVFTFSPDDHNGYEIASGVTFAQWVDGKWVYQPQYQHIINDIADQAKKGKIKKYD